MSDNKDYLTYNQQMKKLRNEKGISCEGSSDKTILVRMGYFNIVNGYKAPFTCGRDVDGNHMYLPNTSLKHLHALKSFDDDLRTLLLKYITKVEEEVRTLTGYKFDQSNNGGRIPWYDANAYSSDCTLQNRMNAISSAYGELSKSKLEYVKFYMDNHTMIPTWIMIKVVNFSTFISVLQNSKKDVTHAICNLYGMKDENGFPNVKLLIASLHWMRKVRNACTHNERIYNMSSTNDSSGTGRVNELYFKQLSRSYSRTSAKTIMDLLVYFKYYLPSDEYKALIQDIIDKLNVLKEIVQPNAFENIRGKMGIKNVSDLEILMNIEKDKIKYNTFDTL